MIHSAPQKSHATIDKGVVSVDQIVSKPGTTSFVSISPVLSGKVRTFQPGEHAIDEYYNLIFCNQVPGRSKLYQLRPGVKTWTPETARNEEERAQLAREAQDVEVQEQVMAEDPSAFGVDGQDVCPPRPAVPKKKRGRSEPVVQANQPSLHAFFKRAEDKLDDNLKHLKDADDKLDKHFKHSGIKLKKLKTTVSNGFVATQEKLDDLKETLVEMGEERARLLERCDHFEHMSFVRRGQMGSDESKKVNVLRKENERLKRQVDGRLKRIEDKQVNLDVRINTIEDKLDQILERL